MAHGFFVPVDVEPTLEQRIVEAMAGMPTGAAVTGWAALAWTGTKWFDGNARDGVTPLPVPVAVGDTHASGRRRGVQVSEDWLFEGDVTQVDGLPVTIPERSVCFEARRARSIADATRVVDLAASADRIDLDTLTSYINRLVGRPGIRVLRRAAALASENVWSPMETPMRFRWLETGLADALLCNAPIFDGAGNHLLTPDLFDPLVGVFGEYDGLVHVEDGVRGRDLDRESLSRDHGLEHVAMINSDLRGDGRFERRLESAYRRAGRGSTPTWTLQQPPWWVDTSTVAARRALTSWQRERWLRWQAA